MEPRVLQKVAGHPEDNIGFQEEDLDPGPDQGQVSTLLDQEVQEVQEVEENQDTDTRQ